MPDINFALLKDNIMKHQRISIITDLKEAVMAQSPVSASYNHIHHDTGNDSIIPEMDL